MKRLSAFFVLLFCAMLVMGQDSQKVLFIGNSYTEANNLPLIISNIAQSTGHQLEFDSNTPGGCTFRGHCSNESMDKIRQGGWDFVVLQEQSQTPSFPQWQVESECFPYAETLVNAIRTYNPQAVPMFYMTWGRKYGDPHNAESFPVLGTYEGMDSMIYERYMYMGQTNNAPVCPVGRVWRYLRNNNPEIELYQSDNSHPSKAGSYAAACAFYTMIFEEDPMSITYNYELNAQDADIIRQAVHEVVWNNLSFWQLAGASGISVPGEITLSAYPNPVRDKLYIECNIPDVKMVMMDPMGRMIPLLSHELNTESWAAGIYMIKAYSETQFATIKILKL